MKLKIFLRILAASSAVLIIASIIFIRLIDTESRDLIKEITLSRTGYELIIAGEIEIDFFPSPTLILNDTRLLNPSYPQELASTSALSLVIDTSALLRGDLYVRELSTDDLHINVYSDATGKSIWSTEQTKERNDINENSTSSQSSGKLLDERPAFFIVENVRVSNASIDIQNVNQGLRYSINNMGFESRNINKEGKPFDIDLNFNFLNNGMTDPLPIRLNSKIIEGNNFEEISIAEINFSITPMLVTGSIIINNVEENLTYEGYLESNNIDVIGLLQTLGYVETETQFTGEINATQDFAFTLNFFGDDLSLTLDEVDVTLGETQIQANGDIRFPTEFTPANIRYNVIADKIDFSPFNFVNALDLEQQEESFVSNVASQSQRNNAISLPVDTIKMANVLGSIAIESITANDLIIENVNLFTNIEDGVLDIELQPTSLYGGTVEGSMRVDTNTNDTQVLTQLSLNRLNIIEFLPAISRLNSVTGQLDVEASYEAMGSTTNELLDTLNGATSFTITENSVDIGLLKQVFTAIAALSPTGESIQQWPDVLQFGELGGYILLEDGITDNQALKLRMDNLDIGGNGGIDLSAGAFDYDLQFTILGPPESQTIPINELYHGVPWPVKCDAQFTDEISQYCRPDFNRVREIFTQLGTNMLQQRFEDQLTDQIPSFLQEPARQILRNLFN